MDSVDSLIVNNASASEALEEEDDMLESANAKIDKQVEKDMEDIYLISDDEDSIDEDTSSKDSDICIIEEQVTQEMEEEEDIFQSMNAELDKQIAQDMEAIRNYISKADDTTDSLSKRIEFFNNMDSSYINNCIDSTVSNHILYQHTVLGTIKWHECTHCDYRAKERSKLRDHIITKHSSATNANWYVCPHCSYMSRTDSDLRTHLRDVHGKVQEHKCKSCDSSCSTQMELLRHMKNQHDAVVFQCAQCEFITEEKGDLRQHLLSEHLKMNVSWYKCAQCAYRTIRKFNLDRHIMYKHSGIF